jgi:hypothetical protein
MTEEQKRWIDNASYETLLRKWRFAPVGDPMFQGEDGAYYSKVMFAKRDAAPDAAVRASKNVGWER